MTAEKEHRDRTLYLRFSQRKQRTLEEVRSLHPKIIDVRFPRQKSARFCYVEFDNAIDTGKACKEMKEKYKKQILVKPFKDKKPFRVAAQIKSEADSGSDSDSENEVSQTSINDENPENVEPKPDKKPTTSKTSLRVTGLPLLAAEEVLKNLYPKCTKVTLLKKKINGKRAAVLSFGSKKDCEEAFDSSKDFTVNGDKLAVEYSTS